MPETQIFLDISLDILMFPFPFQTGDAVGPAAGGHQEGGRGEGERVRGAEGELPAKGEC